MTCRLSRSKAGVPAALPTLMFFVNSRICSPSWLPSVGEKKFITAGCSADYVVVAARTGGPGMIGISLFLVEKGIPGFRSRRLKTQGWWSSNTVGIPNLSETSRTSCRNHE